MSSNIITKIINKNNTKINKIKSENNNNNSNSIFKLSNESNHLCCYHRWYILWSLL